MIWSDGHSRPDDYAIIHEGRTVGRICRINSPPAKERWCWARFGGRPRSHGPNGGIVDSLDEANAAFRAAWERDAQELQKAVSQNAGERRTSSSRRADKIAMALLGIAAGVAAVLALSLFIYPTWTETIGGAIALFVAIAAVVVLPLWLTLRIAVWVTRVFGEKKAQGDSRVTLLDGRPLRAVEARHVANDGRGRF
jgi:hypothetical protein